jgi:hypothetical protein
MMNALHHQSTTSHWWYHALWQVWETLPSLPRNRTRYGAALVSGKIYFIGGRDVTDAIVKVVVCA